MNEETNYRRNKKVNKINEDGKKDEKIKILHFSTGFSSIL